MKRQITDSEKAFANNVPNKILIVYKGLSQLNKNKNNPMKKWAEDESRDFTS